MNPIEAVIRRVDAAQQGHHAAGFAFGVIKKFGDDNGGVLVASLAYAGFVSLFPLLLILVTALGLVASSDPSLKAEVLGAVQHQVPVIGAQLTENVRQLRRSSIIGLVVGLATLLWGTTRLAQAGIFTMEQVWNLPGPSRPGYVPRLGRSGLFLGVLTLGVAVTTGLTAIPAFGGHGVLAGAGADLAAGLVNVGLYVAGFRVLTPHAVPLRRLLPGAVVGGVAWTVLQAVGTLLVGHTLNSAAAYHVFATVLGLLAWVYLAVEVSVYAAEINVVLARRLWPRAIVQPPLTEADRASMALQALHNQRREEQQIKVTFNDRPPGTPAAVTTPRTPAEAAPDGGPTRPPAARRSQPGPRADE
jgi:YihY family inner membrane protein